MRKMYTIFTPTYNRAEKLQRVYNSLIQQKNKNFEWLVIDDGSTDNTKEIINKYIKENLIKINYIYQENQGKQAAWNTAIKHAKYDYFIGIDSDDAIIADGLEKIDRLLNEINLTNDICAIRFNAISKSTNDISGTIFKEEGAHSWKKEVFEWNVHGEKLDVWKTEILKKNLYPINKNIKFIPEIWLYSILTSQKYLFYYSNQAIRLFWDTEFENDGDRLTLTSIKKHALGQLIARRMLINSCLDMFFINPKVYIKHLIRYTECNLYQKQSSFLGVSDWRIRLLIIIFYPVSYYVYKSNKDSQQLSSV